MSVKIDELFYELEVRTGGVKEGVENAERSLNRFTQFVKANPMAAVAALGAATLAVGAKATAMAAEVEKAGRRIETVFPGITKSAKGLSNEFGVAQESVLRLMDTIERNGERSRVGLEATARAALKLNQAVGGTPEDLNAVAGALDQVLDLFQLTGDSAERVAAQLFAISKGRVPLNELVDAFRASASTIRDNNLSLDEAAAALTKLLEAGLPARQAASALADEIGKGRDSFAAFVGPVDDATQALGDFDRQVAAMGESADMTSARIRERLSNAMIDLGNNILPTVAKQLENIATALDHVTGRSGAFDDIDRLGEFGDIEAKRGAGRGLSARQRRLARFSIADLDHQISEGDIRLGELAPGQIDALARSLEQLNAIGLDADAEAARLRMLTQLNSIITLRTKGANGTTPPPAAATPAQLAAGQAAIGELQETLAGFTADLADDTAIALARFRTEVAEQAKTIPPEQAAQFKALTDQIIAQYEQRLADIRSGVAAMQDLEIPSVPLTDPKKTPAEQRQASLETLRGIPSRQTLDTQKFVQRVDDHAKGRQDAADAAERELQATLDTARLIDQAVQGALDLAGAFGAISEETKAILSDLSQVATGIGPLLTALKSYQAGAGGIGAVLATALPVVGGIASIASTLFGGGGESPEEARRREALQHNTAVLERLTAEIGNLGLPGVTGSLIGEAGAASAAVGGLTLTDFVNRFGEGIGKLDVNAGKLERALDQFGTSREELQKVAESLDLDVNFLSDSAVEVQAAFRALAEAIRETELTKFAQTFEGQMKSLSARFELFDITDPIAQLDALLKVQREKGSTAIANAFAGLDLSTAAGREAAERQLQGLFEQLNSADKLSTEQQAALFGGLTGDEFLQSLLEMKRLLDAAGPAGQTEGFAVSRTITEVTGSRLAGILTSQDARLAELVELGRAELAALTGRAFVADASQAAGAIPVPAIGGGGDLNVTIEGLQVTAPAGTADPAAWGQAAGKALAEEVDQALGSRVRTKARHMGSALTTG